MSPSQVWTVGTPILGDVCFVSEMALSFKLQASPRPRPGPTRLRATLLGQ